MVDRVQKGREKTCAGSHPLHVLALFLRQYRRSPFSNGDIIMDAHSEIMQSAGTYIQCGVDNVFRTVKFDFVVEIQLICFGGIGIAVLYLHHFLKRVVWVVGNSNSLCFGHEHMFDLNEELPVVRCT